MLTLTLICYTVAIAALGYSGPTPPELSHHTDGVHDYGAAWLDSRLLNSAKEPADTRRTSSSSSSSSSSSWRRRKQALGGLCIRETDVESQILVTKCYSKLLLLLFTFAPARQQTFTSCVFSRSDRTELKTHLDDVIVYRKSRQRMLMSWSPRSRVR